MPNVDLQLRQEDAKLVFLAVAYHLGRPGSELDPITKLPVEHGLAETARDLQPQLRNAVSEIRLVDAQLKRLLSGMLGTISELKTYPMLELRATQSGEGRRSSVPGFDRSLLHLYPEIEDDVENALRLAEQMLMLKRRLDETIAAIPEEEPEEPVAQKRRSWWPFRR
ncbi:MAG TPA: hypothetical protein VJB57_17795 [Dehalococcoidia bacterium]|nr:hypothetical protein [Dehalococcoidia bacterium]